MTNTNDVNYRPQAETYAPNVRQANTSTSSSDTCNAPHQSRPAPRSTCHRRRARHRAENQTPTNDAGVSRLEDEDEEASEPRLVYFRDAGIIFFFPPGHMVVIGPFRNNRRHENTAIIIYICVFPSWADFERRRVFLSPFYPVYTTIMDILNKK